MKLNILDIGGKVVKDDNRYVVKDNSAIKNLIVSSTDLKPGKSTSGHSHAGQEEVYIFRQGHGEMEVNHKRFQVKSGDIIFIKDGDFHRVHNTSSEILEFVCVFDGVRSH